jgi:hypothetical protein
MANTALAAWSVKFLGAITKFQSTLNIYNRELERNSTSKDNKGSVSKDTQSAVNSAAQAILSLRSELSGILNTSKDIDASKAVSILTPLDTILASLEKFRPASSNKGAKFDTKPLLAWLNQYIKPLI